ncbi:Rne/Rng family ribonuclease [Desulforhopalus sp. IMCC35007]|uniref:Rne/Rng family ribonuclease n=1 Tax=Desulforhopalus sp. IMCC35007 TaxID=2569543 RepID=UPI0010AE8173|nr:Rne/Rng family ribonuclease [Desulforhopalus sp. IMCC35007]TKB11174.1 Rne/Rng family ribonuclease [Desulforhopalus sp. IMCC35007]
MTTDILINATNYEVRLALVEDGNLSEFHMQRPTEKGLMGNVYKGRVVRVLPGMQAAFVDIGLERTGFLYVDDVCVSSNSPDFNPCITDCANTHVRSQGLHIEDLISEGQELLVQVSKDPIGTKGARLTCHITLPCRNLVFIPQTDHIGISRKIEDEELRLSLKALIEQLRPQDSGFIVRTVAEHATTEELEADMEFLMLLWDDIIDKAGRLPSPCLVHEDIDIVLRSIRDFFTMDVDNLIIDHEPSYLKILDHVKTFAPQLKDRISLYSENTPIFESYNIEVEISRAIEKKVWLRSGGYIIIESTEALSVIDVNTGRYVGKNDLNATIFKTNMEAAVEIAYQLRLRNIGGIIIIDFIDMEDDQHREQLFETFKEAVKKDKSRNNILKLSEFGLVQMTRKRNSENLHQLMCEPCHYCSGEGMIKSRRTICYDIFRVISRNAKKHKGSNITLRVHPRIAELLQNEEESTKQQVEKDISKRIIIAPSKDLHIEKYEVIWQS